MVLYGANFAKRPAVQNTAQDDLEITGNYMVGSNARYFPRRALTPVTIDITNAAAGSGDATITATGTGSTSHQVRAGSEGNRITITFTAAGTMDNGRVRLNLPVATAPEAWGPMQSTASAEKNHINIVTHPSAALEDAIYSDYTATAYLDQLGPGGRVTFTLNNAVAQSAIGLAEFYILSDDDASGDPVNVAGETEQTDAQKTANEFGLGRTYTNHVAGELRIQVVGGDGGSGTAAVVIDETDAGLSTYDVPQDDGTVVSDVVRRIHAGDDAATLKFTYTATETLQDAELRFTVPPGWSEPQASSSSGAGYTEVTAGTGAQLTFPTYSGRNVTVPISLIESGGTIVIEYGVSTGGAKPPTETGMYAFEFRVTGSAGTTARAIAKQPTVQVYSQAGNKGSASVDPGTVTAGDMTTVTITYDPVGQIVGGRALLTVPAAWFGDAEMGAMGSYITVSSGAATYSGGMLEDAIIEHADFTSIHQVLVTGLNLAHNAMLTFTINAPVPLTMGDVDFDLDIDGADGPNEGEFLDVTDSTLTVTVADAAAGSGMVMLSQGTLDADGNLMEGKVVNATEDNTVRLTYTAIGEIGEGKKITVTVPDGWSAPTVTADMQGTFTTKHYLKLADDDADGMPDAGSSLADASTAKVEGAADDAMDMIMVATVLSEASLMEGDMVVFTYTGMSPEMPEASQFITEYDSEPVEGDSKVIVQSADGAEALALEASDFTIEDGPTTVTVKLVAADGSVATSDDDTVVTLTASSGTITSPVTIAAGGYMATATLTATDAANITITASATGLTGDEETVLADTDNVMIASVTLSQTVAKEGDTVMVTVMGTGAQDGMFSVGDVITDEDLTEDEAGSYTGSFTVVADLQDGMHNVIVSLNGTDNSDDPATVTIDTMAPTVSASTDAADMVRNGDTVTITATADDGDGSGIMSVMANVAALDTTQTDPVALTMGDDGSYSAEITISEDNEAANGTHTITVTATDMAGNESDMASADVALQNSISFTSMIPTGANLFHVPLNDPDITTVGSLRTALGDAVTSLIVRQDGSWEPDSDDVMVTSDLGIYLVATSDITATFEGDAWEDTTVSLAAGANLVGLPVNDPSVTMAGDISGLFADGVVLSITAGSGGQYTTVSATSDVAVAGDAAYYIVASAAGSATLTGDGWENGGDGANAAPIALSGYKIGSQTPALAVYGSVTDEITGLAKEGFRVKVKNLTTKAGLSEITSVETAEGYSMAFVDLKDARAARVGDILEISADSPNPLIGVKPVRHVVTVDDVKNGTITLEDLIAYEIPAETELLRNYPNPFNPETWIPYHLSEDADVSLTIYDVNGVLVRDIDVGHQTAAKYDTRSKAIYWDGRNQFGEQVASGIYFYSLSAGDFSATRKMVILK